ncbi:MAG: nucleoside-diphosphate sugar epimerase/dehydratase [Candidatus Poribacteria bacterium]|nr:nucleoside-diphosphate sugar epimerase/dehydratase [Candidatus Poribacteria bacterium]MDE0505755.1 nucleoside-diphosphate sugar epimerase/dehydratase [Candidatus Poribacteria bacterium]
MPKSRKRLITSIVFDVCLINLAFSAAYYSCKSLGVDILASFVPEGEVERLPLHEHSFIITAAIITIVRLVAFLIFRLYKPVWRYASVREFLSLIGAIICGTFALMLVPYVAHLLRIIQYSGNLLHSWVLFSMDGFYNIVFIGLAKYSLRIVEEYRKKQVATPWIKVLIVGTGEAGIGVLREIRNHPEKGYLPVGFITDNREKVGQSIQGLEVLGTTRELAYIVHRRQVDEIVIAMPSASEGKVREIVRQHKYKGCKFKIVPSIHAILDGHVSISQIRDVRVEDLLNRSTSSIDLAEVSKYLSGRRVMVTGAGGSIGSELCRQVAKFEPELLILVGRGENSLYHIDIELNESDPNVNRAVIVGDIRDRSKIDRIMEKYRPHIIFHAAAHKHVKFMETHPDEAVKNNILGTKSLIDAAIKHHVQAFILVSSDKAVNPTSVMGASKRVTEKLIQSKAKRNGTDFIAVRFGNVIDSRGSVLPNFKRQIAKGGPVTVTHREVTRFFMTIPESVQLLIQAGAMGNGGEIFILDMGEPIKILDLAQDLIRLSGLEVDQDIKIEFTGLEPGEKLYEELLTPKEGVTATKHQRIFVGQLETIEETELLAQIGSLEGLANRLDTEGIIAKLQEIVPTYKPQRTYIDQLGDERLRQSEPQVINLPIGRKPYEKPAVGSS